VEDEDDPQVEQLKLLPPDAAMLGTFCTLSSSIVSTSISLNKSFTAACSLNSLFIIIPSSQIKLFIILLNHPQLEEQVDEDDEPQVEQLKLLPPDAAMLGTFCTLSSSIVSTSISLNKFSVILSPCFVGFI
jgi:hypothetical protein